MIKKILFWGLVVLVVIQLIPVNRTNKPVDKKDNFVSLQQSPAGVTQLLQRACYDCHSDETKYPWYSYVAPISWTVKDHVNEGKARLNYSEWSQYNKDQKTTILQKSVATIEQRSMPMPAYILKHPEANLNNTERNTLTEYFKKLLSDNKY
ncbi:heme-binding domain-containing protein [Elizabethkingia ursingii]|uniref:heme-binding domain-containing protein n=1 Tax=Elizabethkingia ursingii TaxID=1756150 RepID=UPI0009E8885A|nr:heme-binding domain-containing protein [Elizabethkingia ursingii]